MSVTFYRAFIATATWIPVTPLVFSVDLECTIPEEWGQVSLQHIPDYDYTTMCKSQAFMDFKQEQNKQKEELKLKEAKEEEYRK